MPRSRLLPLAALAAASALALSGCSAAADLIAGRSSMRFETQPDLDQGWHHDASWVPADATSIRLLTADDTGEAVLRATSATPLDPAICAETPRESAPTFEQEQAPDVYSVDTVWACGSWSVIPTADGWFGWTPNDLDEEAASPARAS